jgi:histone H3/H4
MALEILKEGNLKRLFEKHSGCEQSAADARERVDQLVTEFLIKIAQAAGKSAEAKNLVRIMPENVDDAFNEVLGQSSVTSDPSQFLTALNNMDIAALGLVLRHIADWTAEDPSKK